MLDFENKPYIVQLQKQAENKYIEVKVPPEAENWHKELTFKGVFGKETFYEPVKGQPTKLKAYESYVYREYLVKAGTCKNCRKMLDLGKIEESCCRIRKMGLRTGLYSRCFLGCVPSKTGRNSDLTQYFMNYSDERYFKLIKEEPVTTEQVLEKFNKGVLDYISDFSLILLLEQRTGRTF